MCTLGAAQKVKASSLLNVKNCPQVELKLFDDMLQYDFHDRPTMDIVVRKLEEMKKGGAEIKKGGAEIKKEGEETKKGREVDASDGICNQLCQCCVLL